MREKLTGMVEQEPAAARSDPAKARNAPPAPARSPIDPAETYRRRMSASSRLSSPC